MMTAAIVVAAVAIVVQTALLIAMFLTSRRLKQRILEFLAKVEPMAESGQRFLEEARATFGDLSTRTSDLLELTRKQLGRVDEVLAEATTRTRVQMDRMEMVLDDTVNRFQETTSLLQNGIMKPLRQISGLTIGVRTALSALLGARRTVEQATHDEEMFI
ncbi:MAG TPA: hypothetical protein PLP04_05645 [Bryobacteraceae bacterium]|nr:hypothetical protein [Bryobacteraceae bacterium]